MCGAGYVSCSRHLRTFEASIACKKPTRVRQCSSSCCRWRLRPGCRGWAVRAVQKGVEHGSNRALLAEGEWRLQPVEVVVVQHHQRLRIHPAQHKGVYASLSAHAGRHQLQGTHLPA